MTSRKLYHFVPTFNYTGYCRTLSVDGAGTGPLSPRLGRGPPNERQKWKTDAFAVVLPNGESTRCKVTTRNNHHPRVTLRPPMGPKIKVRAERNDREHVLRPRPLRRRHALTCTASTKTGVRVAAVLMQRIVVLEYMLYSSLSSVRLNSLNKVRYLFCNPKVPSGGLVEHIATPSFF